MNKIVKSLIFVAAFVMTGSAVFAEQFNSQSVGGATGLITTPTARISWDEKSTVGLDLGVHYLRDDNWGLTPKATVSFLGKFELGGTFDWQERSKPRDKKENDMLIHGKFKFYDGRNFALAVGTNFQIIDMRNDDTDANIMQLYIAGTYSTMLFCCIPADVTFAFGKTFDPLGVKLKTRTSNREFRFIAKIVDDNSGYTRAGNFDFSVGVDIDLAPSIFKGYVHWISDFANYSYSVDPMDADSRYRAVFNTGFRIQPFKNSHFKWNIDLLVTDFMDYTREVGIGTSLGFAF